MVNWDGLHSSGKGGKRESLGGLYVRSKWEANFALYLNFLQQQGKIEKWEYEPDTFGFPIKRGSRFYTPDFKVFLKGGYVEYYEIKGYMDQRSATKLKRMKKYYPAVKVILIEREWFRAIKRQGYDKLIPDWE